MESIISNKNRMIEIVDLYKELYAIGKKLNGTIDKEDPIFIEYNEKHQNITAKSLLFVAGVDNNTWNDHSEIRAVGQVYVSLPYIELLDSIFESIFEWEYNLYIPFTESKEEHVDPDNIDVKKCPEYIISIIQDYTSKYFISAPLITIAISHIAMAMDKLRYYTEDTNIANKKTTDAVINNNNELMERIDSQNCSIISKTISCIKNNV